MPLHCGVADKKKAFRNETLFFRKGNYYWFFGFAVVEVEPDLVVDFGFAAGCDGDAVALVFEVSFVGFAVCALMPMASIVDAITTNNFFILFFCF